ncbi:MAG: Mur ligase family protein [Candidatus Saccharibacteria bacterium]
MAIVGLLQSHNYRVAPYVKRYWQTNDFAELRESAPFTPKGLGAPITGVLLVGSLLQIALGILLIVQWHRLHRDGWWAFGLALIISYPIVWAHLIVGIVWLQYLLHPKKIGRALICSMLESQVKRLRAKHSFKVVAVVGGVGKTSTKAAIAKTLEVSQRVRWQTGNYNDRVTVPLVLFDQVLPGLFNLPAWLKIWRHNERIIRGDYPYDVVIVEFGIDGPGQMQEFGYITPDVTVLTALVPEHMEYFGTLDNVASEELLALSFAHKALVNIDDTPARYLKDHTYSSYSLADKATFAVTKRTSKGMDGQQITVTLSKAPAFTVTISLLGEQGAKVALAAAATAHLLGETPDNIEKGLQQVEAFSGRMRLLAGIKNSVLIDDSYNASPIAVNAALDVLYESKASQRIAILGSMNELGDYSPEAHHEVGVHCDPKKLDMVVTIGHDAEVFLAPVATEQGCTVHSFASPYAAGKFVKKHLQGGAVVLAKGSQNRVFAEESLKPLLAKKDDAAQLVRQSEYWLTAKRTQFSDAPHHA